jgi:hypothetical protein
MFHPPDSSNLEGQQAVGGHEDGTARLGDPRREKTFHGSHRIGDRKDGRRFREIGSSSSILVLGEGEDCQAHAVEVSDVEGAQSPDKEAIAAPFLQQALASESR